MAKVRITAENLSQEGGVFATPIWIAAHDGSFDTYDRGVAASAELERLAEDGTIDPLAAAFDASGAGVDGVITAPQGFAGAPVVDPGEIASTILDVDALNDQYFSYATMVIPSNDAFVANGDPLEIRLFDEQGNFLNPGQHLVLGSEVLDAGTEVNTELEAAFINQTGPNTGTDEGGVVTEHPGFIGSIGNPDGTAIILGGTTAAGTTVTSAGDFTAPGFEFLRFSFELIEEFIGAAGNDTLNATNNDDDIAGNAGNDALFANQGNDTVDGGSGDDVVFGGRGNDQVTAGDGNDTANGNIGADFVSGGAGNDTLFGGQDNDVVNGDDGNDIVRGDRGDDVVNGNIGQDVVNGASGNDNVFGGQGNDVVNGGSGDDVVSGDRGNDFVSGGTGSDTLTGGSGDDVFVHIAGDGTTEITDFNQGIDRILLNFDGVGSLADVLNVATVTTIDSDTLQITVDSNNTLIINGDIAVSESDFIFI